MTTTAKDLIMTPDLRRDLREFQDYADDVQRSRYQTFGDVLARLISVLEPSRPLGSLAGRALPSPSFDEWHQALLAGIGGLGGRGLLTWPSIAGDRVALQLELLRRVADSRVDLFRFCHQFLESGSRYDDMIHAFTGQIVRPFARDFLRLLHTQPELSASEDGQKLAISNSVFVDPGRIAELKSLPLGAQDLRKLVRLCEELNACYRQECYFAVAMLTRAVVDHIPPFFGLRSFSEVVSNYSWGRSRTDAMEHLEKSARKVADVHLHSAAAAEQVLPNRAQVNFGPSLDVLLAEVVKLLRNRPAASGAAAAAT
jgi:hypothetical protein